MIGQEIQSIELWWTKPYDPLMSMRSLLQAIRAQHADRPAVLIGADEWLTHGDLHRRAERLAKAINDARRANPGPIVCLVGTNASLYVCLICVINAGGDFSMLDPASPPKRNQMAAQSIDARVVLVDHTTAHLAQGIVAESGSIINIDTDESEQADTGLDNDNNNESDHQGRAFIFTSGSTGQPKGVIRSLQSMLHSQYNFANRYSYDPSDIMLYMGSPGHVGTLNDALSVLLNGHASVALSLENLDISAVWKAIIKYRITKASLPPSLMRVCLQYGAEHEKASSIRCVASSGEPLLRSDIALFYRVFYESVQLWQSYGSTECGHMCAGYYAPEYATGSGPLPLSKLADGVRIEVLDENGIPVLPGNEGSIRVRTPSLAQGYTQAYQSSQSGFGHDEDGRYFITGDRAQLIEDNKLIIIGRADRQVNIHGRRLELSEVESAILLTKGWAEASVVLLESEDKSPQIAAMIRQSTEGDADLQSLNSELRTLLPQSSLPRIIKIVDCLPKTITGKTDLQAVTDALQDELRQSLMQSDTDVLRPVGPTENWIADAWQEVMRSKQRPGRDVGFDEYGGDSLNAINLCLTLEQQFGIQVGLEFITDHPTIVLQAEFLQQSNRIVKYNRFVPLQSKGDGPVIFLFPGLGGHAWVYRAFARELNNRECDLIAMNYLASAKSDALNLHPRLLAEEVAHYIASNGLKGRQVYFAGYSLGSLVAASVSNVLDQTEDAPSIHALFLLDPSPLLSSSSLKKGVRFIKNTARLSTSARPKHTSFDTARRHLDMEVQRTSKALRKHYRPSTTSIINPPCFVILTRQGDSEMSSKHKIFDRCLKNDEMMVLDDLDHLDLLRAKGVERCASWVWDQIESINAEP